MPYDIVQLRWNDDPQMSQAVKDQDGHRLPVKLAEFDGDVILNTTIDDTVTVESTSLTNVENSNADLVVLMAAVLAELRVISTLLQQGLNVQDNLDALRNDPTYSSL